MSWSALICITRSRIGQCVPIVAGLRWTVFSTLRIRGGLFRQDLRRPEIFEKYSAETYLAVAAAGGALPSALAKSAAKANASPRMPVTMIWLMRSVDIQIRRLGSNVSDLR